MLKSYFSKVPGFYRSSHSRCSVRKVFAKFTEKHLNQRLYFDKVAGCKRETLAQAFSCEYSEISKNAFFTEHLRTAASSFSFSEAATGGVVWKKVFLKISQNSKENTCGLQTFQEHLFYRTLLDDCFQLFPATLLKRCNASSVWKTSDEYSLSLKYIISFSAA